MNKTTTTPYDVAEYLRTPEASAAYLEACFEEADGDAAFMALRCHPAVLMFPVRSQTDRSVSVIQTMPVPVQMLQIDPQWN